MTDSDKLPSYERTMQIVSLDVVDERIRQHAIWGVQRHSWPEWISILTEEVGEAAQACNVLYWANGASEGQRDGVRHALRIELVQVAAVAVAIVEHIDELRGAR